MAIFKDKPRARTKKSETRRLSEIVLDMLVSNVPDERIIATLQELGLTAKRAQDVLQRAKQQFDEFYGFKLEQTIDRVATDRIKKRMDQIRKEFALQTDLKFMEQKDYTTEKAGEVKRELDSLKSEFVALKLNTEAELEDMKKKTDMLKIVTPQQRLVASGLILAGLFMITPILIFGYSLIDYLLMTKPIDIYVGMYTFGMIVFLILAIMSIRVGARIYMIEQREFTRIGLGWMKKKKPEEKEETIQELVKEKEII